MRRNFTSGPASLTYHPGGCPVGRIMNPPATPPEAERRAQRRMQAFDRLEPRLREALRNCNGCAETILQLRSEGFTVTELVDLLERLQDR